jgi:uncharacterized protein with PQ loop repeat
MKIMAAARGISQSSAPRAHYTLIYMQGVKWISIRRLLILRAWVASTRTNYLCQIAQRFVEYPWLYQQTMPLNEGGMSSLEIFYEALGILGGVFLSVCTVPQIWHMYKTKDARDLQKRFLILYLIGTIFTFVYLVVEDAWAAWITMILEVNVEFNCARHKYNDCIHRYS